MQARLRRARPPLPRGEVETAAAVPGEGRDLSGEGSSATRSVLHGLAPHPVAASGGARPLPLGEKVSPFRGGEQSLFVAPHVFELEKPEALAEEVFGPILHVVRYRADRLDQILKAIAGTGYGLTLGVHSRIDDMVERVVERLPVGNVYVNRNMIGAVVGVQPFGGHGLSGTGPKAGGPHYLLRFATEQTVTINTAAAGGNASLLAMEG